MLRDEDASSRPDESEGDRLSRNWSELLQELRVAQAGVQILFAFLLTLPFLQRWAQVTEFQRNIYLATLLLVTLALALFVGPAAYHRIVFRLGAKPILVETANVMALAGLFVLALAINLAVLLIVDVLMGGLATTLIVVGTSAVFLWLWMVMPALVRRRLEKAPERAGEEASDGRYGGSPGAGP